MRVQAIDQLILGVVLFLAALLAPYYIPWPWLGIPLGLTSAWVAGQRIGEAIHLWRARQ